MKLRKWDKIALISGGRQFKTVEGNKVQRTNSKGKEIGSKGKEWTILKVFKESNKVLVEWINKVTRHIKGQAGRPGQIVQIEKPVDASNLQLVCPYTDKPTKIGFFFDGGKKFRYSKRALKEGGKKTPKDAIIK